MHISLDRDDDKLRFTFSGSYSDQDLQGLNLDDFDNSVLKSPIKNGADILQNLEILFRRYYEQMAPK